MPRPDSLRADALGSGASPFETLHTPQEIAKLWRVDVNTVRRLFIDQPGVLKLATAKRGKRSYVTLRIPPAVVERVFRERCK